MTAETKTKKGGSVIPIVISALLALGAAALAALFFNDAQKAAEELQTSKDDYRRMVDQMKKPVEEFLRNRKNRAGSQESNEDMLTFLDRKARQAQIPPGVFNIARNQDMTVGPWKETSYTVTLQSQTKDTPVERKPVVDLLRFVETERRSTKSKNLRLTFSGADFSSVAITFSSFVLK
jgi:hypothetical protein